MLLSDYTAVEEIDTKILELHRQLEDLYDVRRNVTNRTNATVRQINRGVISKSTWTNDQYNIQAAKWSKLGITLPRFSVFQKRLEKAMSVISEIGEYEALSQDAWQLIVIPPASKFNLETYSHLWQSTKDSNFDTYFDDELLAPQQGNRWRVMVVYDKQEALHLGSAKSVITSNQHLVAGYDMTGLGIIEYAAYTLLRDSQPLSFAWELLMKGYDADHDKTVASAAYINNSYRFEIDDARGLFETEYFRPAMEIR